MTLCGRLGVVIENQSHGKTCSVVHELIVVLLQVTGPGMIGLGIWLLIALGEYEPVVDRAEFSTPAFLVISAGSASVLAGLLGCLGGLSENRRLLVLVNYYFFLMYYFICV